MVLHVIEPKKSNDHDYVKPERYNNVKPGTQLDEKFNELTPENTSFEPMILPDKKGTADLPDGFFSGQKNDQERLFREFFDEEVLDRLVFCTNTNAARIRDKLQKEEPDIDQRPWRAVSKPEILCYLGILMYMGIVVLPQQDMYWNTQHGRTGFHSDVTDAMALKRWQQIHRYFHVFDATTDNANNSTNIYGKHLKAHDKIEPLANIMRTKFHKYWSPGTHVAVDECIQRFTGRSPDIVNIPSKPTPIGYKIWCLGDEGYICDFLFHVPGAGKGSGPQGLRDEWKKFTEIPPTQKVVLELAVRMRDQGKNHCIWMDNLFTSQKLLLELRNRGIAGAGTVRNSTNLTKREQMMVDAGLILDPTEESHDMADLPGHPQAAALEATSSNFKEDSPISDSQSGVKPISKDPTRDKAATKSDKALSTRCNKIAKSKSNEKPKEAANGLHPLLSELKRRFNSALKWGAYFSAATADGKVLQFAWKDSSIVLFMSTIGTPGAEVIKPRKRPTNCAAHIRSQWGNELVKEMPIPELINSYNCFMNGVDLADQMRVSYEFRRRCYRTWFPLWHFLRETAITNAMKIWRASHSDSTEQSIHLEFRLALAHSLMQKTSLSGEAPRSRKRPIDLLEGNEVMPIAKRRCSGNLKVLIKRDQRCKSCQTNRRTINGYIRKPLDEISVNNVVKYNGHKERRKRAPRTPFGCTECNTALCRQTICI